jgi:ParB family chromosome partitioning protein
MSKRDIHEHVLSRLRSVSTAQQESPASESRRPTTYMGQVGAELKVGLKARIQELETQLAGGDVVLKLDPKRVRSTAFSNRDRRSLEAGDEAFMRLREDIRAAGNRVPIEVRTAVDGVGYDYEIVSGHRRHAACLALDAEVAGGFPVRALVVDSARDPAELVKGMHRENFIRENPSPYEYGVLYAAALKAGVFATQKELAAAVGTNPASVSNHIALVELPPEVFAAFADPRAISVRWIPELSRALKERGAQVLQLAREIAARAERPTAEQVKAELLKPPTRLRGTTPALGRYEQTIRLKDKKTVGAKLKRDGRNLRLTVGATITTEALLRRMTDRIEATVREVLREDEGSGHE